MKEKDKVLALAIAQSMIAYVFHNSEPAFNESFVSAEETVQALMKAYSELNVVLLRGETSYVPQPHPIAQLQKWLKEIKASEDKA